MNNSKNIMINTMNKSLQKILKNIEALKVMLEKRTNTQLKNNNIRLREEAKLQATKDRMSLLMKTKLLKFHITKATEEGLVEARAEATIAASSNTKREKVKKVATTTNLKERKIKRVDTTKRGSRRRQRSQ